MGFGIARGGHLGKWRPYWNFAWPAFFSWRMTPIVYLCQICCLYHNLNDYSDMQLSAPLWVLPSFLVDQGQLSTSRLSTPPNRLRDTSYPVSLSSGVISTTGHLQVNLDMWIGQHSIPLREDNWTSSPSFDHEVITNTPLLHMSTLPRVMATPTDLMWLCLMSNARLNVWTTPHSGTNPSLSPSTTLWTIWIYVTKMEWLSTHPNLTLLKQRKNLLALTLPLPLFAFAINLLKPSKTSPLHTTSRLLKAGSTSSIKSTERMMPFRNLLKPGKRFGMGCSIQQSIWGIILLIVSEIYKGVEIYDKNKLTCLGY